MRRAPWDARPDACRIGVEEGAPGARGPRLEVSRQALPAPAASMSRCRAGLPGDKAVRCFFLLLRFITCLLMPGRSARCGGSGSTGRLTSNRGPRARQRLPRRLCGKRRSRIPRGSAIRPRETLMKRSGAQLLLDGMKAEKVEVVFGFPGGVVIPVFDALYGEHEFRLVLARHEQGALHGPTATRGPRQGGVCLVTSGPGATNTVTGLATANFDSVPLVVTRRVL